jgi:hypothetical protein
MAIGTDDKNTRLTAEMQILRGLQDTTKEQYGYMHLDKNQVKSPCTKPSTKFNKL